MASTSEKGHAKNIANASLLNRHIAHLGERYNPSNPKLVLANLDSIYADAVVDQEAVNNRVAPYSLAVDRREQLFAPLSRKITKLRKVYKTTEGVTASQLEDFMILARKLKGVRKAQAKPLADAAEEQIKHSVSQMSYDQRTSNLELLILLFQNTPNYNPNENEYKIQTLLGQRIECSRLR